MADLTDGRGETLDVISARLNRARRTWRAVDLIGALLRGTCFVAGFGPRLEVGDESLGQTGLLVFLFLWKARYDGSLPFVHGVHGLSFDLLLDSLVDE